MMVIVVENAPARLRGRLGVWLLEARAGTYIGNYSRRVRERIVAQVEAEIGSGNAVVSWSAPNHAGFEFVTFGDNRRRSADFDGFDLISFDPVERQENLRQ